MKELCIPIPNFMENQIADVEVTINGKKRKYSFRVESFPWNGIHDGTSDDDHSLLVKIDKLRDNIKNYEKGYELVQIYTPREDAKFIQVLFRQRDESE
jgi:hypothetical protein